MTRAIRNGNYKLIRRYHQDIYAQWLAANDISNAESKKYRWYKFVNAPRVELYDLAVDPYEKHNLAGEDARKEVLDEMDERLLQWQHDTRDPLLIDSLNSRIKEDIHYVLSMISVK